MKKDLEYCNYSAPEREVDRHSWYRQQGWWTGESLLSRYAKWVQHSPSSLAVADDRGKQLSHLQLWEEAGRVVSALKEAGIGAGDVVIIFLPNRIEWQLILVAILRLGAIPANLPIRNDADTLAYTATLVGAKAIVTCSEHRSNAPVEIARQASLACEHSLLVAELTIGQQLQWHFPQEKPIPAKPEFAGLDHLMFTSSTTGLPKAVMHTADTLAALNGTFVERFSLAQNDSIFMSSPMGHSVGAIHGARLALYNGAPLILQDQWDPELAIDLIAKYQCVFTAAATPFLKDLVEFPWNRKTPKLETLKWFLCGGAQVPPKLMEKAWQQFPQTFVTVLWGMTEGGLTTCLDSTSQEKLLSTAGIGLPGLELRALNAEGDPVACGEEGELVMRGPGVFVGYYGQNELYHSLLTKDGFFKTGDLVCIDQEGYVQISGRLKDLIIRGGVNISPVPAENILSTHPNISYAAVIGFPDERLGERICAVIVPKGDLPDLDEIVAYSITHGLPKYHCPELMFTVDQMPMTPAGKIRKNELRELIIVQTHQHR
ncbi:MAG: AMP-binding protein [SAR324 cluster bacterium]|nr:AMP-binding protein [SAR324 cluster bacterium]